MSKVLFVYPNREGYPMVPLGITVLMGILKDNKHKVDLFDVTFMIPDRLDHNAREKTGTVKKVDFEKYWGESEKVDVEEELRKKVNSFKPDVVAFSVVENNYSCAKNLFKIIKEETTVPVVVGGIFPSVAPKYFEEDENVDIICIGEGEYPLLELTKCLDKGKDYSNIKNLIVKKDGKLIKNEYYPYYTWSPLSFQDWDKFDERHLWKAFVGKMWKTGCFETSRGCPYSCTYCNNHIFQKTFKCLGAYHRTKSM